MPGHIFISYGRRDAAAFVQELRSALTAAGHGVFVDVTEIRPGEPWDESLADAIDGAKAMIAVLSPHAVRRAGDPRHFQDGDSVCLDEIVRARDSGIRILPVMIERCEVPLPIARLNYIDLVGWQRHAAIFHGGVAALLAALSDHRAELPPRVEQGWDGRAALADIRRGFAGRDWLFRQIQAWADDGDAERAVVLVGPPGIGKSAFLAEFLQRDGGRSVIAHHVFQSETPATRDAGRFVRSLAAQLSASVPGYAAALRAPDTARLLTPGFSDSDPASALEGAIVAPLIDLAPPEGIRWIVLDALDEALGGDVSGRPRGPLVPALLAPRIQRLPSWIRLLATSRPDPAALRGFEAARRLRLDAADARNCADLDQWLASRLPEATATRLANLAAGNFLYARLAVEALNRGDLGSDLAGLPPALAGLYSRFFQRSFPSEMAYAPARRVLACIMAAREKLSEAALTEIAGLRAAEARATFDALAPYLDRAPEGLGLHHKALADWLTQAAAGDALFLVDPAEGTAMLTAWCRQWASQATAGYRSRHLAWHLAEIGAVKELRALLEAGCFHAARLNAGESKFALAEDWGGLASACLAIGDDAAAATLAVTEDDARRDAVVAAIANAGLPSHRLLGLIGGLRGAGLGGRMAAVAGLRLAASAGLPGPLLSAAAGTDPALVAAAVPEFYRLWRDHRDIGWTAFEALLTSIPNWLGLPRGGRVEVAAGVSFAILTRDRGNAAELERLSAAWKQVVQLLARKPVTRFFGRRWVRQALVPLLRELMARQPDYQPFNFAEIRTAFSRPVESHQPALDITTILADPHGAAEQVVAVLLRPDLPFDIHLMLAAERTLVVLGSHDAAGVIGALDRLMDEGPSWFRQSILYVGFHVLMTTTTVQADWLATYRAWAATTIGQGRATLQTETARYALVPHMAWPHVVHHRHQSDADIRFIATWLAQAAAMGDLDFARRALRATGVLSFVYGLDSAALDALWETVRTDDPALRDAVVQALANIRFSAGRLVDDFLDQADRQHLKARVAVTPPDFSRQDLPTWVDAFFNGLLVGNHGFRAEVVHILRQTAQARSADALIGLLIDWVVRLLEGGPMPTHHDDK